MSETDETTIIELAENWLTMTFSGPVTRESAMQAVKNIMFLAEKAKETADAGIRLVINSPGGSILDGMMLFDVITEVRQNGVPVETGCYGMAASMGGVLLQAGTHRWIGKNSWVMIHNAAFGAKGKTWTIEDELEFSKILEEKIIEIYTLRSGGKLSESAILEGINRKDWWIDADTCYKLGIVDEVRAGLPEQT